MVMSFPTALGLQLSVHNCTFIFTPCFHHVYGWLCHHDMFQSWAFAFSQVPKLNESKKGSSRLHAPLSVKMFTSYPIWGTASFQTRHSMKLKVCVKVDQTVFTFCIFFRDLRGNKIKEIFGGTFDYKFFLVNL